MGTRLQMEFVPAVEGSGGPILLHDSFNVTGVTTAMGTTSAVAERYGYDSYGTPRVMNASWGNATSTLSWEFRFQASYLDTETGLHLMRYRYMHPKLGRWISRDPIGFRIRGANLRGFISNNPSNHTDATGLQSLPVGFHGPGTPYDPSSNPFTSPYPFHDMHSCVRRARNEALATQGRGHGNDPMRHCVGMCLASKRCGGEGVARAAGVLNEFIGIGYDVSNLQTGAFEFEDFRHNEVGIQCGNDQDSDCDCCCHSQTNGFSICIGLSD